MSKNDTFYIRKVLQGDKNAFGYLIDKYKSMAYTLAYRVVKQEDVAEDIAQQAFIKAYTNLKSHQTNAKFSSWLYRIVYNTAISHARKNDPIDKNYADLQNINLYNDEDSIAIEHRAELVRKAIDCLPKEESSIITLYYFDDLSVKDIAEITEISISNVKIKLYRARKKLEELLQNKLEQLYI